jgi:hypothetical protein
MGLKLVAVLCARPRSIYHTLEGVEVYDKKRDAHTFPGGMPVIAHPPCRAWSAFCAHQANPEPGEKELGLWCVEQVRRWGGVLEQPAHSRLWETTRLPKPGRAENEQSWSLEVWQAWFGYPQKKATWLYFSGLWRHEVDYPLILTANGGNKHQWQVMSGVQKSATTPLFAQWLVAMARKVSKG